MKTWFRFGTAWMGMVFAAAGLRAQPVAGFGTLSGVVRDASGAVVPKAAVVVSNEALGLRRNLVSNEAGLFTAPNLPPAGGYAVAVEHPGFARWEARDLELLVGQNINLNIVLVVAAPTVQVEVSAATPVVEQTRTGVAQVVVRSQIQELPINGRRVDSFVLLTPAVVPDGTYGLLSFRGIAGGNAFLTDGNDTTNQFFNENAGRTRISAQISQDAVQEFQVLSSGYSAEFGRASGGVINTVTRSGTNELHGTAYWFFRNRSLNARDRYATYNPREVRHQAGASLGGPVRKDRLFYFGNAEVTRRAFPLIAGLRQAPLFNAAGNFVGRCDATPQQCQAALKFLDRHFQTLDRRADQELLFGKLDWRPNERHSLSGNFNYLRWISPNGIQTAAVLNNGAGVGNNGDSTVRTRWARLSWIALPDPSKVHELRVGWFKDRLFDDVNPKLIPPETGRVQISVQGQGNLGVVDYLPRVNPDEVRWQLVDTLTWTVGRHFLKFGFDFTHTADLNENLRNQYGTYSYATFTAFAQDFSGNSQGLKRWQSYSQRFGNRRVETAIRDYSVFAQDQWRLTPNLTFNYGLRYEYAQFTQPKLVNPEYPQTGKIPQPGRNFAPRLGLAYSLNQARTVIRAGYGIFYARFQGGLINTFHLENGIYQKVISLNAARPEDLALGPVFPNRLSAIDREPPAGTVDVTFPSPDFRNPYTQQGDFGIEQQLTANTGLSVSYLWSRGAHLTTVRDLNIGPLGPEVSYRILDAAGRTVGTYVTPTYRLAARVNPKWRRVNQVDHGGNSYYNALVVQLRKRMSRGVEGTLAYTWSHAIDYNQGGGSSNIFFSDGPRSLFNGAYKDDKSSSALDQRHRLVATTIWTPQFTSSQSRLARYLVNHWQLSQITTLASAFPATPVIYVSGTPFAGAAFTTTLNGFGGSSRVPFWPAASLDIDQVYRTDARLSKILPFSERWKLYLNFEAFNVFNHVSNTAIYTRAFTASGGALVPDPRLGEPTASGGFPDGTNARRAQLSLRLVF